MATVTLTIEGSDLNEIEEVMVNFVNKDKTATTTPAPTAEAEQPVGY